MNRPGFCRGGSQELSQARARTPAGSSLRFSQSEPLRQAPAQPLRFRDLTFPDHENAPSKSTKRPLLLCVPLPIPFQLRQPELGIRRRRLTSLAAVPVPEAAVNHHNHVVSLQDDVRRTGQSGLMHTEAQSQAMKQAAHSKLCGGVATSHGSHVATALIRGDSVHGPSGA